MNKIKRIKELTKLLNTYRNAYYNESKPIVSDYEYDSLYDELQMLETETGFVLNNSPTHSVGYEVKSKLQKVKHLHPMLSLDKTKSVDEVITFLGGRPGIAMLKMDGLTTGISYSKGNLVSAETRGDGIIGEDALHNAKTIKNLPQNISVAELDVDGEVIITREDFNKINDEIIEVVEQIIEELKSEAEDKGFPIDEIMFGYDDVACGESLGATGHHAKELGVPIIPEQDFIKMIGK